MANGYSEQFDRVKRYFSRFKQINDGKEHNQSSPNYDDDIYAFFQNCYHLKDWIKNDSACSSWNNTESFINQNTDLRICADLCNALKHLTLTYPRSNKSPNFDGGDITLDVGEKETVFISIKYKISTSSGEVDAFQLAKSCLLLWEQFINDNLKRRHDKIISK